MLVDGEEIETTPWHLFYTADGQWVPAEALEVGDEIRSLHDEATVSGTVDSLEIIETTQTMYDLSVDTVYNFAVGDGQWLVHNCPKIIHNTDGTYIRVGIAAKRKMAG